MQILDPVEAFITDLQAKLDVALKLIDSQNAADIELRQELKTAQDQILTPREQLVHDLITSGKSWAATKIPYLFGGSSSLGEDCSFFTESLYGHFGIVLPRTSYQQFTVGTPVGWNDVQPGDLLFFKYYATVNATTHVAICIGNGQMLHTNAVPQTFHISDAAPSFSSFVGAKRVIA
jgi:cell wall-associated NlpC family hydrolase